MYNNLDVKALTVIVCIISSFQVSSINFAFKRSFDVAISVTCTALWSFKSIGAMKISYATVHMYRAVTGRSRSRG